MANVDSGADKLKGQRTAQWRWPVLAALAALAAVVALTLLFALWLLDHDSRLGVDAAWQTAFTALTAFAVVTSAVAAVALYGVTRETAVTRTSFDVIYRQVHDKDIIDLLERFNRIFSKIVDGHDKHRPRTEENVITYHGLHASYLTFRESISQYVGVERPKHDYDAVFQLLNYYEALSIGVHRGAIKEAILKDWWREQFVADWIELYIFVRQFRDERDYPDYCIYFQSLADGWATEEEKKTIGDCKAQYERLSKDNRPQQEGP